MPDPQLRKALRAGDATVIGVGQGKQSARWALPRQLEIAQSVRDAAASPMTRVLRGVDSDGERSVVIVPKTPRGFATELGERFGQRSVLLGKQEVGTVSNKDLLEFGDARVSTEKPEGFWTYLPSERLYYSLTPVQRHTRAGRPVVGYTARRKRRSL